MWFDSTRFGKVSLLLQLTFVRGDFCRRETVKKSKRNVRKKNGEAWVLLEIFEQSLTSKFSLALSRISSSKERLSRKFATNWSTGKKKGTNCCLWIYLKGQREWGIVIDDRGIVNWFCFTFSKTSTGSMNDLLIRIFVHRAWSCLEGSSQARGA